MKYQPLKFLMLFCFFFEYFDLILLVLGTYVVKDCIHCGKAILLDFFIYRSWFFKTVVKNTIVSNFELCMIWSFVAPNKPRMVDDKVNGVTYVIIEMAEDEDE